MLVVVARRDGVTPGGIGVLLASFSACLLIGSLLSPLARRAFSVRAIMLAEFYAGLATVAFVVQPNVYVLAAALLPQAFVLPITDSVVIARRLAMTPDRLLGRVEAARTTIARTAQPLGPLVAGLLLGARLEPGDGGAVRRRLGRARGLRHGEPRSAHTAPARGSRLSAAATTSSATSVGVVPTLMPTASSASFFACAVPDEPEMIAPA